MDELVENVLRNAAEKEASYKGTEVNRAIDLETDEGNLLTINSNPLEEELLHSNRELYLKSLARDDVQSLINKIWELPAKRHEDAVIVELLDPNTVLPREKPIPKPKSTTRWQEYAKLKGIQNKKKGRMVWDDQAKEWKPRWGYKRAGDETRRWAIEVPQNSDPYEDQFEKINKAKKERVAKNELQRLRNIARGMKGKVPGVGLTPTDAPDKGHISRSLAAARNSDASLGKFSKDVPKEKPQKNTGKRRKFESNTGNFNAEKTRSLDLLKKLNSSKNVLDVKRVTNRYLIDEDSERRASKGKKTGKKGSRKGGKFDAGAKQRKTVGKSGPKKGGKRK